MGFEFSNSILVATVQTKLKKLKKGERLITYDCKEISQEYRVEIRNRFEILERDDAETVEVENNLWEKTKEAILETAEKYIPKKKQNNSLVIERSYQHTHVQKGSKKRRR